MTTPGKILQKSGKIVQRSGKIVQMNASGAAPCCCGDTCCSSGFLGYYPASGGNRVENQSMDVNVVQVASGWTCQNEPGFPPTRTFSLQPACTTSYDVTSLSDGSLVAASCGYLEQGYTYNYESTGVYHDTSQDLPASHIFPSASITYYPGVTWRDVLDPYPNGAFFGPTGARILVCRGYFTTAYKVISLGFEMSSRGATLIRLDGGFDETKVLFGGYLFLAGPSVSNGVNFTENLGSQDLYYYVDYQGRLACYTLGTVYGEPTAISGNAAVYVTFAGSGGLVLQDVTFMFNLTHVPTYTPGQRTLPTLNAYGAVTYTTDMRSC